MKQSFCNKTLRKKNIIVEKINLQNLTMSQFALAYNEAAVKSISEWEIMRHLKTLIEDKFNAHTLN